MKKQFKSGKINSVMNMQLFSNPILVYILLINIISVIVCVFDKQSARVGGRRISERNLLLLCFAGGSLAMYITMRIIRHKTRHNKFMVGIPLIIFFQIVAVAVLKFKLL